MSDDTPVVEGERLKLHCSVKGYPTPLVVWSVGKFSVIVITLVISSVLILILFLIGTEPIILFFQMTNL